MACCKECASSYHACGSCYMSEWEYDFCDETCRNKYIKKEKEYIIDFYNSLSWDQKRIFVEITENEPDYVLEYITELCKIDREKRREEIEKAIKEAEEQDLYEIAEHATSEIDLDME